MVTFCCIPGCLSNTENDVILSFFSFPLDPKRCSEWVKNCNRQDFKAKSPVQLHRGYRVCAKHFTPTMFAGMSQSRLKKTAVPTLFMSDQNTNTVFEISESSESIDNLNGNSLACEETINLPDEDMLDHSIKIEPVFFTESPDLSEVLHETSNISVKLEVDPVTSSDGQGSTSNRVLGVSRSVTELPMPPLIMLPKPNTQIITENLQLQKCCLPYCNSNSATGPKVDMFSFPKDPVLKKTWLDNLYDKPLEINHYSRVCLLHFAAPDVEWVTKHLIDKDTGKLLSASTVTRLVQDAVPFKFSGNQTQRSDASPVNTEPIPQPLETSVNNEVSKEPQTNSMEVEDKAYFKDLDEAFEKLEHTKLDQCWFKIKEPRYIYLFYLDPQPNPTLIFAVHLAEDLTLSLKQDNKSVDEIQCRNKVTISFPVKVLDLQALSVILKEIEFYLKYRAQHHNNAKRKSSSVLTKFRPRIVTTTDNVCKLCLDDVEAYIRCVKCQNEFHPGCLAAKGLDDCDKCRRTFNRLSEKRSNTNSNSDINETAFNDNQYLIRIVKEEEEKNNILEKNCNMLEERINRLTSSLAK